MGILVVLLLASLAAWRNPPVYRFACSTKPRRERLRRVPPQEYWFDLAGPSSRRQPEPWNSLVAYALESTDEVVVDVAAGVNPERLVGSGAVNTAAGAAAQLAAAVAARASELFRWQCYM